MEHNHVGVAILTCHDWGRTLACLAAVHTQTAQPRRIVVCYNGSGNDMADHFGRMA